MKDHVASSKTTNKHNELSEPIVEFKPYEIDKQSDVSIDMNLSNCSWPTPPCTSCGIGCLDDDLLSILLVLLLISYANEKGLNFKF
jgi:hypothetical protein